MSLFPSIKWAQLQDIVHVTLEVPDVTDAHVSIEKDKMTFSGLSNGKDYSCTLVFTGEIDQDNSKFKVTPREVVFALKKVNEERWSNLLKDKSLNRSHVKIDWNKWVDSDAEEEAPNALGDMGDFSNLSSLMGAGSGGMDMEKMMAAMKGRENMNQTENEDSDDELPELEKDEEIPPMEIN